MAFDIEKEEAIRGGNPEEAFNKKGPTYDFFCC